jgi:hypothetical protein
MSSAVFLSVWPQGRSVTTAVAIATHDPQDTARPSPFIPSEFPMARQRTAPLKHLPEDALLAALARTPSDLYVLWNGEVCPAQPGSIRSRALGLVTEVWEPLPLRTLLTRAARLSGSSGLDPDTVRSAVRMHQAASHAAYFLVRRTLAGDYLAVTDVPYPSTGRRRLQAGDVVLSRGGARFDDAQVSPRNAA